MIFTFLIFIGTLILDSVILPGIFHLVGSLLTLVFLVAFLLAYGDRSSPIIFGLLCCFVTELLFGLYLGILAGAWLVVVWLWHGLIKFFNIKPFQQERLRSVLTYAILGQILLVVFIGVYLGISHIFHGPFSLALVDQLTKPSAIVYGLGAMIGYLLLFHGKRISRQY